jgi:hypothetical protein
VTRGKTPADERGVLNLDGWCVAICPGCGTQVNEWLDEDGGPGHVEHELCPMCAEVDADEDWS